MPIIPVFITKGDISKLTFYITLSSLLTDFTYIILFTQQPYFVEEIIIYT